MTGDVFRIKLFAKFVRLCFARKLVLKNPALAKPRDVRCKFKKSYFEKLLRLIYLLT
jgi:hypothetical protein